MKVRRGCRVVITLRRYYSKTTPRLLLGPLLGPNPSSLGPRPSTVASDATRPETDRDSSSRPPLLARSPPRLASLQVFGPLNPSRTLVLPYSDPYNSVGKRAEGRRSALKDDLLPDAPFLLCLALSSWLGPYVLAAFLAHLSRVVWALADRLSQLSSLRHQFGGGFALHSMTRALPFLLFVSISFHSLLSSTKTFGRACQQARTEVEVEILPPL